MRGICRLCLEEKELIKRSHLFPNFMYQGIGDEKNRMYIINTSKSLEIKIVQSGIHEEYILCRECDNNILSRLERYANNYLYSQPYRTDTINFKQIENISEVKFIRCTNIDYAQFKLFLASLLWRASISSSDFFKDFKLTIEQEEQLRKSILTSVPLQEDDFACVVTTHQDEEVVVTDLVFCNASHERKVSFFINHFAYLFYLEKEDLKAELKEILLNCKNEMGILKLPKEGWTHLRESIMNYVGKASKRNLKN